MEEVVAVKQLLHAVSTGFPLGEIPHQLVNGAVKLAVAVCIGIHGKNSTGQQLLRVLAVGFLYYHITSYWFIDKAFPGFCLQSNGLSILFDGERVITVIRDKAIGSLFLMEQVIAVEQRLHTVNAGFHFGESACQFIGIAVKNVVSVFIRIYIEDRAPQPLFGILTVGFFHFDIPADGTIGKSLVGLFFHKDSLSILGDGEGIIPIISDKAFRRLFLMDKIAAKCQVIHPVDAGFCFGELPHPFIDFFFEYAISVCVHIDAEHSAGKELLRILTVRLVDFHTSLYHLVLDVELDFLPILCNLHWENIFGEKEALRRLDFPYQVISIGYITECKVSNGIAGRDHEGAALGKFCDVKGEQTDLCAAQFNPILINLPAGNTAALQGVLQCAAVPGVNGDGFHILAAVIDDNRVFLSVQNVLVVGGQLLHIVLTGRKVGRNVRFSFCIDTGIRDQAPSRDLLTAISRKNIFFCKQAENHVLIFLPGADLEQFILFQLFLQRNLYLFSGILNFCGCSHYRGLIIFIRKGDFHRLCCQVVIRCAGFRDKIPGSSIGSQWQAGQVCFSIAASGNDPCNLSLFQQDSTVNGDDLFRGGNGKLYIRQPGFGKDGGILRSILCFFLFDGGEPFSDFLYLDFSFDGGVVASHSDYLLCTVNGKGDRLVMQQIPNGRSCLIQLIIAIGQFGRQHQGAVVAGKEFINVCRNRIIDMLGHPFPGRKVFDFETHTCQGDDFSGSRVCFHDFYQRAFFIVGQDIVVYLLVFADIHRERPDRCCGLRRFCFGDGVHPIGKESGFCVSILIGGDHILDAGITVKGNGKFNPFQRRFDVSIIIRLLQEFQDGHLAFYYVILHIPGQGNMFHGLAIRRSFNGIYGIVQLVTNRGFGFPDGNGLAGIIFGYRRPVFDGQGFQLFSCLVVKCVLRAVQDSVALSGTGFGVAFVQLHPELFQDVGNGFMGDFVPLNIPFLIVRDHIPVRRPHLGKDISAADGDILKSCPPIRAGNGSEIDGTPVIRCSGQTEG